MSLLCGLAATRMAPHNFGPVSHRDQTLYTACRPGNPAGKTDAVSDEAVKEWIHFMKEQGIQKVLCLLDENEYGNYCTNLCKQYSDGGLRYLCQPMKEPGANTKVIQYIQEACDNDEKVVAHCTGGVGRAGRVAAAWLVHRYGLTPTEATQETLAAAEQAATNRKADSDTLAAWLDP